jgi:FK506-binding protein 1
MGRPFKFRIFSGQVVRGWDEGVSQLSLGEKARIIMTPDVAYGARGIPGLIPPNATLFLEVTLLAIH